jgi:hypothetical protein
MISFNKQLRRFTLVPLCLLSVASAQVQNAPAPSLEQRLQTMQRTMAVSQQQLHTYQWLESTTFTINGSAKQPKQSLCHYGPDGHLIKSPVSEMEPAQPSGGLLKQHIIKKKTEEFKADLAQIGALTALYLPLNQEQFQNALHTRRVDLERNGASGTSIIVNDYVKSGDQLRITFNPQTLQIQQIAVRTYFDSQTDVLKAEVDFSELNDQTAYPSLTSVNAIARKVSIATVESDFSKPAL